MQVNRIVVHELIKEQHVTGAELITSEAALAINNETGELVRELNRRFRSHNATNAVFGDEAMPFPSGFRAYNDENNEQVFMHFTQTSSEDLRTKIHSIAPAKGGYLVFADYEYHGRFVAVFLIRNKAGMLFVRRGNRYVLDTDIQHIDFENVAMACRINCDLYNDPDSQERYLRVTKKDGENVSEYFREWITMGDSESVKTNTSNLYLILKELPLPVDQDGNEIGEDVFMRSAVDFIRGRKRNVNIRQLSLFLYDDENTINDYAVDNNIALDSDFKADGTLLDRYLNVQVTADRINLKFPRYYYEEKVRLIQNDPDIIIIQSPELANEVRNSMQRNDI